MRDEGRMMLRACFIDSFPSIYRFISCQFNHQLKFKCLFKCLVKRLKYLVKYPFAAGMPCE